MRLAEETAMSEITHLEAKGGLNSKQLALFELLEPKDSGYSNFVEFFDNIPIFVDFGKKRYWDYSNVSPSITTDVKFNHEGRERTFVVTLKPGRITKKDGTEALVYPSVQREEVVYDALRKLACSGHGGFYEDELGTSFTLKLLQKELKSFKKTYSIPEIKESLKVLRSAEIEIKTVDGSFEWQPSYLSNMALTSRAEYLEDGGEAKCMVLFDNIVSTSVKQLDFREYNYAISQATKHPIAKYLIKRLDRRFKAANDANTYSMKMSTIFKCVYRELDQKMSNNTRHMNAAIKEMMDKRRIKYAHSEAIKSPTDARKTVDYLYTFVPHEDMIQDMIRFHGKKSLKLQKNANIPDSAYQRRVGQ